MIHNCDYQSRFPKHEVALSQQIVLESDAKEAPLTLTCRWPKGADPLGFIIFSHGLGSSRHDYAELAENWAAYGYLVVQPTFPDWIGYIAAAEPQLGLDPNSAEIEKWITLPEVVPHMMGLLHKPFYWKARIQIVKQILDQSSFIIHSTCPGSPEEIPCAAAGHSFGAYTSQLLAGATIDLPGVGPTQYRDPRIKAAALISAQGRDQQGLWDGSWSTIACPMVTITGTLDQGAKGQGPQWKSEPYEFAPPGDKYLAVFQNAGHQFGGITRTGGKGDNIEQRKAMAQLTLAFWNAHLLNDPEAKSWLAAITTQIGQWPVTLARK